MARFGGAGAAQPTHAYQIDVYRATVRPDAAAVGGIFAPHNVSLIDIVGVSDPEVLP